MTEAPTTPPAAADQIAVPAVRRRDRTWLMLGSLGLALVGLTWLAGGFETRTDVRTDVTPGTTVSTGPYEFTFDSATVQKTTNYSDETIWKVVATGSGRVTGDEAMAPTGTRWMFAAKHPSSEIVAEPENQSFGPEDRDAGGGYFFTPGLPPIPYRLELWFPAEAIQPGDMIQLAVFELEYRDTSLLRTGELSWANSKRFYRYGLPLDRLPDDLD